MKKNEISGLKPGDRMKIEISNHGSNAQVFEIEVVKYIGSKSKCAGCGIFLKLGEGKTYQGKVYCDDCLERRK